MLEEGLAGFDEVSSSAVVTAESRPAATAKRGFDTYQVVNHGEFGRRVAFWARHPEARPGTVTELRQQVGGDLYIPASVRSVEFAQGDETRLMVYLPPVYKLDEAEARVGRAKAAGDVSSQTYPLPDFYAAIISGALADVEEILYSRIGDYSVAGCR